LPLMFIGEHVTDEHKRVGHTWFYPLRFVGDVETDEHRTI
jgi:hypothetical protein